MRYDHVFLDETDSSLESMVDQVLLGQYSLTGKNRFLEIVACHGLKMHCEIFTHLVLRKRIIRGKRWENSCNNSFMYLIGGRIYLEKVQCSLFQPFHWLISSTLQMLATSFFKWSFTHTIVLVASTKNMVFKKNVQNWSRVINFANECIQENSHLDSIHLQIQLTCLVFCSTFSLVETTSPNLLRSLAKCCDWNIKWMPQK